MQPKYPDIIVRLTENDGNAFVILALCQRAARNAGLSAEEFTAFREEATSGDYAHLLQTVMGWFECH